MRRTVKDFRNAKGQRLVYLTAYDYPTARLAEAAGVEVFHGYSARSLIVEGGAVRGVRLADVGLGA